MIRIYHPWPVPVQAVCYSEPSALTHMQLWVQRLRERGLVGADVGFTVRTDDVRTDGAPVGVLTDGDGARELPPSSYLVFAGDGLRVIDRTSFLRAYREP